MNTKVSQFPEREEMSILKSGNDTTTMTNTTTTDAVNVNTKETDMDASRFEMVLPTYQESGNWAKKYIACKPAFGGSIIEVAFTGHRPKDIVAPGVEGEVKSWMIDQITKLVSQRGVGRLIIRSGFAAGVDLWAAGAALHLQKQGLDVRLHGYLPCQPERQTKTWAKKSQAIHAELLEGADQYYVCTELEGEGRQNWSKVMNHRNRVMVEGADVLMAIWKGTPGGTKNTVFIARDLDVPVVMYNPVRNSRETTTERFGTLVSKLKDIAGEEAPVSAEAPNNTGASTPDHDSREESDLMNELYPELTGEGDQDSVADIAAIKKEVEEMERIMTPSELREMKEQDHAPVREVEMVHFEMEKRAIGHSIYGHEFTLTGFDWGFTPWSPPTPAARPDLAELHHWEGVNARHVAKHLRWSNALELMPTMTRNGGIDGHTHGLTKDHPTEMVTGPKLPSNLVERSRYVTAKAGSKAVTLMLVGDRDVDLHMEQTILGQNVAGYREQTRDEATRHRSMVRELIKAGDRFRETVAQAYADGHDMNSDPTEFIAGIRKGAVARDERLFDMKDLLESLGGSMDMRSGEASLDPRPGTHPGSYRMVGGIEVTPCDYAMVALKNEDFVQKVVTRELEGGITEISSKPTNKVLVLQRMEKRIEEESSWFVASGDGASDLGDKINRVEAYKGENQFENRITRATADEYIQETTLWKSVGLGSYSKRIDHVEVDGESSLPKHLRLAGIASMFDISPEDAGLVRRYLLRADMKEELHEAMKDGFRIESLTRDGKGNPIPQDQLRAKWLPVSVTREALDSLPASGLKQLRVIGKRSFVETCRYIVEGWDAPTKNTGRLEGELSQPDWVLEDPTAFDMEDKVEINDDDAWKEAMDSFGEAEVVEAVETDDGEGWEFNPAFESDADLLQGYVSGHRKVDPNVDFKVDYRDGKEVTITESKFTYLGERHTVDSAIAMAQGLTNDSDRFSDLWEVNRTKGLPWALRKAVWGMASERRPDLMEIEFASPTHRKVAQTMADCADRLPGFITQRGSFERTPSGVAFQMTPGKTNPGMTIGSIQKVLPFVEAGASVSVSKVLAYDSDGHLVIKRGYYVENYLIEITNKEEDGPIVASPSLGNPVELTKEQSENHAAKLAKGKREVMPGDGLLGRNDFDRPLLEGKVIWIGEKPDLGRRLVRVPRVYDGGSSPYAHLAPSHRQDGMMEKDETLVCYLA